MKKKNIIISIGLILIVLTIIFYFLFIPKINKKEALNIVYNYLNKNSSSFSYIKIEKEMFDKTYEIKLNDGEYNYEIEIDIRSGEILDFEKIKIDNYSKEDNKNNNYITNETAKQKALEHAKLNNSQVVFTKIQRGYDDGIMVYEIEFIYNNEEYEYKIDATTGIVIKFKIDKN